MEKSLEAKIIKSQYPRGEVLYGKEESTLFWGFAYLGI
jgi:hypothetical protein